MKEANPTDLIVALKKGNRIALSQLYDLYADIIYGMAMEIVKDEGLAQEVLQDTFIKVWQRIDQYDNNKSRFFSWIYKIGRNAAIDKIRSRKRYQAIDSSILSKGYLVEKDYNNQMDTSEMLKQLDHNTEEIIRMSYIKGHSQSEISKLLDIPLGTVKSRIRIGLSKLKKLYTRPELIKTILIIQLVSICNG